MGQDHHLPMMVSLLSWQITDLVSHYMLAGLDVDETIGMAEISTSDNQPLPLVQWHLRLSPFPWNNMMGQLIHKPIIASCEKAMPTLEMGKCKDTIKSSYYLITLPVKPMIYIPKRYLWTKKTGQFEVFTLPHVFCMDWSDSARTPSSPNRFFHPILLV